MKRYAMLVCGLVLVGAIALAVACGGDSKKNDNNNGKTPAVATQTALAKATISAGGTSPASSDGGGDTAEPGSTQAIRDRAATQAADVRDERTQRAYDRETEQSDSATSDARDATNAASRDATQQQRNRNATVVPNTN